MKLKAVLPKGADEQLVNAFDSGEMGQTWTTDILGGVLSIERAWERPAEYYQQESDFAVQTGPHKGVVVNMTGVSRGRRKPKQLRQVLKHLELLAVNTLMAGLQAAGIDEAYELFVVVALDKEIRGKNGTYSSLLESEPVWVTKDGVTSPPWIPSATSQA